MDRDTHFDGPAQSASPRDLLSAKIFIGQFSLHSNETLARARADCLLREDGEP